MAWRGCEEWLVAVALAAVGLLLAKYAVSTVCIN